MKEEVLAQRNAMESQRTEVTEQSMIIRLRLKKYIIITDRNLWTDWPSKTRSGERHLILTSLALYPWYTAVPLTVSSFQAGLTALRPSNNTLGTPSTGEEIKGSIVILWSLQFVTLLLIHYIVYLQQGPRKERISQRIQVQSSSHILWHRPDLPRWLWRVLYSNVTGLKKWNWPFQKKKVHHPQEK